MQLGEARHALHGIHAEDAEAALGRAQEQAEATLRSLRESVRGIQPQVLTDHGLTAAAHDLAGRQPFGVHVEVFGESRRLPTPVESTGYFVIAEALTNVAKHAGAHQAQVRVDLGSWVRIMIVDDGVGGAVISPGSGLAGLAERLATLGGTLEVDSPRGGPTTVVAALPGGLR
jgi:signal transduction histidine kinase